MKTFTCPAPPASRRFLAVCLLLLAVSAAMPAAAQTTGFQEAPRQGEQVSGIGLIRGWVCQADTVTFSIDGNPPTAMLYGASRGDTRQVCGDSDNGYAYLINWGLLPQGPHRLVVMVDGEQLAAVDFEVGGAETAFIEDLRHRDVIYGIPDSDRFCTVRWDRSAQNMRTAGCTVSRASGGDMDQATGTRVIEVTPPGQSEKTYHLYVPSSYQPERPLPLVIALHGAAGPGTARFAAIDTREEWTPVAEAHEFIVLAPEASGSQGGWLAVDDRLMLDAVLDDLTSRYNVEQSRIYLWGFSAGGHFAHDLALTNTDAFAAYAVNAGALAALAGSGAPLQAERTIPVQLQVGSSDALRPFVEEDVEVFDAVGWVWGINLDFRLFPAGHTFRTEDLEAAWQALGLRVLPPPE